MDIRLRMISNLARRKKIWISVTATIVVLVLLWQTAIVEIMFIIRFDGPPEENAIGLSFDDGPDWGEEALISALNDTGMRATFFWMWEKIELIRSEDNERFERILNLIEDGDHEVAIHGYFCRGSQNPISRFFILHEKESIADLQIRYYELFGKEPQLYRSHGPRAGRQFYNSLKNSGLELAFGSLTYQISITAPIDIFVEYFQSAKPGTIICAHDSRNCATDYGLAKQIAQTVPELGEIARNRKLDVVTISELLRVSQISD
jgi:hypothetical protein